MSKLRSVAAVLVLASGLGACENGGTDPEDRIPARVEVVDGSGQQGTAGQPLPNPVRVRVEDARGRPVPGQAVNFVVTGGAGGSLSVASATSDRDGIAATQWTLGRTAGEPQTMEARVGTSGGQVIVSGPITATAVAGPVARLEHPLNPPALGGAANGPVGDSLAVSVQDQYGNPIAGVAVTWAVVEGGGTITPTSTSDAQGVARAHWILGPRTDVIHAARAYVGTVESAVYFAKAASNMTIVRGNGVTATAGTQVPVAVRLDGAAGPVAGVRVEWTVLSGGGSVAPPASKTDNLANGTAEAVWTLGPSGGTQTLVARAGPLQQTFTATAIAQGMRTLLAQVPGRVLDADGQRILWLDSAGGTPTIKLRSGGSDVTLATAAHTNWFDGRLFPGGALLSRPTGPEWGAAAPVLVEYRGGIVQELGPVVDSARVEGLWAAWAVTPNGPVLRRDLAVGRNDTVVASDVNARHTVVDVGPNGDVAWNHHLDSGAGTSLLYRYRNGANTLLLQTFAYGPLNPRTDGVNVVYRNFNLQNGWQQFWRVRDGEDELLGTGPFPGTPTQDLNLNPALNAGWLAWIVHANSPYPPTAVGRLRSPGGTEHTVAPGLQVLAMEALSPDGQLVFHRGRPNGAIGLNTVSRSLTTPGGTIYDVGPIGTAERVVWAGSRFLLLSGGSVYELGS
jgi:hypothetical protein